MLDVKSTTCNSSRMNDGRHTFGKTVASQSARRCCSFYAWIGQKIVSIVDTFNDSGRMGLHSGFQPGNNSQRSMNTGCANLKEHLRGKFMVYIQRDKQGYLLRVEMEPFEGMTDNLAVESEELQTWLRTREEVKARLTSLHSTDLEMGRVLEDVVAVLVEQGVIKYTDLPKAAREKLDQRAVARAEIEGLNDALNDIQ
jgi:hypothetical protein